MRSILLLLAALSYDPPTFGAADSRPIPRRFIRAWTKQDDLGYLDQCSILQFWDKQSGQVNVLAFFDSSWTFSHRQASMLRILRERFDRTGFDNIQFFAINAAPGEAQRVDEEDLQVEEETWKQISPSEAEGMPPVVVSPEALIEALGPDIYFIQDTDELQIWPRLRAFRDQILVIDRCGRLTYQVIVPWSILHFPYVKAAILSTYKDEPCGYCQFQDASYETIDTAKKYDLPTVVETSTQSVNTKNNHSPSTLVEQLPTRTVYTENIETPSVTTEESSTRPRYNEYYNDTLYISSDESSSSHAVQTEKTDSSSVSREETSTLPNYTENYDKSTIFQDESSTLPIYTGYTDSPPTVQEQGSTLSAYAQDKDSSFVSNEETTTLSSLRTEKKHSTLVSEEESSTLSSYTEDKVSVSLSGEESPTLSTYAEDKDSPSSWREESSTQSIYNENTESPQTFANEFSTFSVPYTNGYTTATPTVPTISTFPTDYSNTQFESQESSTFPTENTYGDVYPTLQEQSIETENNYTSSTTENPSTLTDQSEYTLPYDFNTSAYNPLLFNMNDDVSNLTSNEYSDGFSNFTKMTEFESSTEDANSEMNHFTDTFDINNITEQQTSETLSARDFFKSRSTNARSVSPNDGSQNHLEMVETNSEASNKDSLKSDFLIPIRIIMRAPHVDEFHDRTMKAHEYLVLKTGQPDYHEHLESQDESKNYEEEHAPVRKKSEAIKRTFGKDESPGLYGEVADYWRNFNDPLAEIAQSNTEEYDDQTLEQETNYTEDDTAFTSSTLSFDDERGKTESIYQNPALVPMEAVEFNTEKMYDHNLDYKEDVDVVDEESKSKLIAHYSKLLPWLYYVLAK